ncbi:hypothetical protein WA1_19345 [Scytonema hofmannii PCC 7110]|uniref:Uncharacterized protein n=1 Tax=Scytonema hofmannii PCC 7110 TaxID=128403 RepID=A0A139XBS5_9CYAN|nr:hypothetical protein [Scytonema hofmannii]KYC42150.1 hypothetical protein WA1_19345 [Scytonema hofmannii PCC 7110]
MLTNEDGWSWALPPDSDACLTVVDAVTTTASADSVTSNVGSTTATTTGNDRVCRTTATVLEPIPSTNVKFQQGSTGPVIVTFIAEWPKPRNDEIPAGSQAAGDRSLH